MRQLVVRCLVEKLDISGVCMLASLPDRYKVYILDTFTVFVFIQDSCLFFVFLSCRSFPVRYTMEGNMGQLQLRRGLGKSPVVWGDVACSPVCCLSGSLHSFRRCPDRYEVGYSMRRLGE